MKTKRRWFNWIGCGVFCGLLSVASPSDAQGRKPETKSEPPAHPVKSTKDSANEALGNVASGIHQAGSAAEDGANKALGAVDQGVHKVVGSDSQ